MQRVFQSARHQNGAAIGQRPPRKIRRGQFRELPIDFGGDFLAKGSRCGDEDGNRVGIVFRLGNQIGGNELRIASIGPARFNFRGPRQRCRWRNRRLTKPLRRGDEAVAETSKILSTRGMERVP